MQQREAEQLIKKRVEYEKKLESVGVLIQSKDTQIDSLKIELEGAEKELTYLRSLLDLDKKSEEPTLLNQKDDKF